MEHQRLCAAAIHSKSRGPITGVSAVNDEIRRAHVGSFSGNDSEPACAKFGNADRQAGNNNGHSDRNGEIDCQKNGHTDGWMAGSISR